MDISAWRAPGRGSVVRIGYRFYLVGLYSNRGPVAFDIGDGKLADLVVALGEQAPIPTEHLIQALEAAGVLACTHLYEMRQTAFGARRVCMKCGEEERAAVSPGAAITEVTHGPGETA